MYYNAIKKPLKALRYPDLMWNFYVKNLYKLGIRKLSGQNVFLQNAQKKGKVVKRDFLNDEKYNEELTKSILSGKPFFSCRYGACELNICFNSLLVKKGINESMNFNAMHTGKLHAGVFPVDQNASMKFADTYLSALSFADHNAFLGFALMEEYLIDKFLPLSCKMMRMRALEPFVYDTPWTYALKNKKVLLIHPYSLEMVNQYKYIKEIFPKKEILPDMELDYIEAVNSSGDAVPENYATWNDALAGMYKQCMTKDFDIALLGCGSYAVPLGAMIKKAGKQAIVLGGMMQLLFGIKGARWEESRPDIVDLYTDKWIRAGKDKQIKGYEKIENGAYW